MRAMRLLKGLALGALTLATIACDEPPASPTPTAALPSAETQPASPTPTVAQPTAAVLPTPQQPTPEIKRPLLPPTPTLEERKFQLPTDFGNNTKTVADDIHVWCVPTCPPVPPATFVAPIILTYLGADSYSYLHLNRDGTIKDIKVPDHPTNEAQERFDEVLQDTSLMEQILTSPECP